MSWFKKTDSKETLDRCNFNLAAREMARFLHTENEEETRGLIIWDTETGKVIFQYAVIKETNTFAADLFVGGRGGQRHGNS